MSGNLSHQIEHHLYPDIPANRYAEMSVEVRKICAIYGQHYNTGRFSVQFASSVVAHLRTPSWSKQHPGRARPAA